MSKLNISNYIKRPLGLCLVFLLLVSTLTSCSPPNPKNFSTPKITVTLDESFEKYTFEEYDLCVKSEDIVFTAKEQTSNGLELAGYELISLSDYANEILTLNNSEGKKLQQRDDYYYFVTSVMADGAKYSYIHCMYEGNDAFWVCTFACKSKDYERLIDDILSWADSIEIVK